MKARDLAALAALGIAGKMAYDKFGRKKDDEPKSKGKLGEAQSANDGDAGESEARMSKRDMNEGSGRRDAGGNTEKLSRQELDVPEKIVSRQERDVPDRIMGRDAAGSRFTDKAAAPVAVAKPVAKAAVTRSVAVAPAAADAVADDYVMPRTAPKPVMPDANRVKAYNPDIMYNTTIPFDPKKEDTQDKYVDDKGNLFPGSEQEYQRMLRTGKTVPRTLNTLAATRNKRAGVIPTQMPNDAAAARIARQSTQPGEAGARAGAEIARKEAAIQAERKKRALAIPTFDPAAPSARPLEKSQLRSLNAQIQGRAKGGAVKMASGGMTSSRMSKPSGASRGDGIAQRGRTRGTLR